MPVHVTWYEPGKIILVKSEGHLTVEDFQHSAAEVSRLINHSQESTVHVLMDDVDVTQIPRSMASLRQATSWLEHPRLGWAVTFGNQDRFVIFVSSVIARVVRIRYRRVNTLTDALVFISNHETISHRLAS